MTPREVIARTQDSLLGSRDAWHMNTISVYWNLSARMLPTSTALLATATTVPGHKLQKTRSKREGFKHSLRATVNEKLKMSKQMNQRNRMTIPELTTTVKNEDVPLPEAAVKASEQWARLPLYGPCHLLSLQPRAD